MNLGWPFFFQINAIKKWILIKMAQMEWEGENDTTNLLVKHLLMWKKNKKKLRFYSAFQKLLGNK